MYPEQLYSVLVVSAPGKSAAAISALLPESDYEPVRYAGSAAAARQELSVRSYDLVLINGPLPDETGARLAADLCAEKGTVPLLLVPADLFAEIGTRMQTQGVFTLSKPTSSMMLSQALRWMAAARERLRRTEKKTATIEEKMEEIRLVNRAKWLLIEQLKMTESDAHRYIEKQAMDRCISRREIALGIIKTYA